MKNYLSIVARLALLTVLLTVVTRARAHETDQYSVPIGREFADLRFEISDYIRDQLQGAVDGLNSRIRATFDDAGQPTTATAKYYAPEAVASAVFLEAPPIFFMVEQLNASVLDPALRLRYPGLVTGYLPMTWIYHHWLLLLDVTKLSRLSRSAMLQIDGEFLGTDKLVHFAHMGYLYFGTYDTARKEGATEAEAMRRVVQLGTGSHPFLSEKTMLGVLSTGVFSNADLAANYAGLLFYRNLTEEMRLKERLHPPLLTRDGPFWRLNDHVRARTDFFSPFVTPHWNEAFNPSIYGSLAGAFVREGLQDRCNDVRSWYAHEDGTPRTREEFQTLHESLRLYDGADYGWEGDLSEMVTVANTCFDPRHGNRAAATAPRQNGVSLHEPRRDALGRSGLWDDIRSGDGESVSRRIDSGGLDLNAADLDGERPLHVAARFGRAEIVQTLLAHGARVQVASAVGLTPLHVAVRESRTDVIHLLLQAGAPVAALDAFGCSPLHDAATRGDTMSASMLLAAGAAPNAADGFGTTPLHLAARNGHGGMVDLLLRRGADAGARNQLGRTPADEAGIAGHHNIAELVKSVPAASPPHDLAMRHGPS